MVLRIISAVPCTILDGTGSCGTVVLSPSKYTSALWAGIHCLYNCNQMPRHLTLSGQRENNFLQVKGFSGFKFDETLRITTINVHVSKRLIALI